jgi:glycosyltransferase involved in cell wall biosynthesis
VKVLVATSDVPFVEGGHRVIARALLRALQDSGHEAEIITTPTNRFGRQFGAYLATRLTDVERTGNDEPVDRLISLRFPSYALKHQHHVCWLNHRMREYYDLWPEWSARLSWKGKLKEGLRKKLIHTADSYLLKKNVKKLFAQSRNVQAQLMKWGNIASEVLYPPPPAEGYYTEKYDGFILSPARLTSLKRIPMLLESLKLRENARAIIAGSGTERDSILKWIRENNMENRVQCVGQVSPDELKRLYAQCRAVYYAPVNEDFGMVTMEAFRSRKPVITCKDSGGAAEVVRHGIDGFISAPEPAALAVNISALIEDSQVAEKMGNAGYEEWKELTWSNTVSKLLS